MYNTKKSHNEPIQICLFKDSIMSVQSTIININGNNCATYTWFSRETFNIAVKIYYFKELNITLDNQ